MIRVYVANDTNWTHNKHVLTSVTSCVVSEEVNGNYDLLMTASLDYVDILVPDNVVVVSTQRGEQAFRVVTANKGLSEVNVWGRHVFYDLADYWIEDKRPTDSSALMALTTILDGTGFTAISDVSKIGTAYYIRKTVLDAIMLADNSVLNVWGGHLIRDNKSVRLRDQGLDRGYSIRLGKNLIGIDYEINIDEVVTRVMPTCVINNIVHGLPEKYILSSLASNYANVKTRELRVDLPENITTPEQAYPLMRTVAADYLSKNDKPVVSAEIDFIELSKTDQYKDLAILEQLDIGDIVHCKVETIDVDLQAQLVEYTYDVVKQRFESVTLGHVRPTTGSQLSQATSDMEQIIKDNIKDVIRQVIVDIGEAEQSIIDRITGSTGGHVVMRLDADGKPYETLWMDTDDVNTASEVVRINKDGIGLSTSGVNGPFGVAMTAKEGLFAEFIYGLRITVDMIEAGVLIASNIKLEADSETSIKDYVDDEVAEIISDKTISPPERAELRVTLANIVRESEELYAKLSGEGEVAQALATASDALISLLEDIVASEGYYEIDFEDYKAKYAAYLAAVTNALAEIDGKLESRFTDILSGLITLGSRLEAYEEQLVLEPSQITMKVDAQGELQPVMALSQSELAFYSDGQKVSYFANQRMMIENAVVNQQLEIGNHIMEKYGTEFTVFRYTGK